MKKFLSLLLIIVFASSLNAQPAQTLDEKLFQSLHGHASLNAVIVVMSIILAGIFITLWRIERKVSRLEKDIQKDNK
ncbi:MAG TPA: hypothetical protein VL651_07250 [Bacteroidia bacterium]|jgi:hypothetical protein|nr:hypothetical protein [Bacteroidia bacterium]